MKTGREKERDGRKWGKCDFAQRNVHGIILTLVLNWVKMHNVCLHAQMFILLRRY